MTSQTDPASYVGNLASLLAKAALRASSREDSNPIEGPNRPRNSHKADVRLFTNDSANVETK